MLFANSPDNSVCRHIYIIVYVWSCGEEFFKYEYIGVAGFLRTGKIISYFMPKVLQTAGADLECDYETYFKTWQI